MNVHLQDKVIFVTGGTSALGRVFVETALQEGATVWFSYHRSAAEAKRLESLGARPLHFDLASRSELTQVKEAIHRASGRLDILIHNAAGSEDHTLKQFPEEAWDKVIDTDLSAVFRVTKCLLPLLYRSQSARILNLISRLGLIGGFGASNYAAAKAGVIAFTKSLAREVGRKGILVNALNPGFMISAMTRDLPEAIKQRQKEESLLGMHSDPAAVARFMVYFCSDAFTGVTGQVFHFDSRPV